MRDEDKTQAELLAELAILRQRVAELETKYHEPKTLDNFQEILEQRTAALRESNDQLVAEIVERRQAEQALKEAQIQFQAVLDVVPGIVSWISSELYYLGVNQHLAAIFELEPSEFIGKDIGFLTGAKFKEFIRQFFASDEIEIFQEIATNINQEVRNYLIVAKKYHQNQAAFVVGIDITQRCQAEAKLRTTKDQLQAVLEAVPGMVSWISSDLHYLGVNRHLAANFDLTPEDFIGKDIGFLDNNLEFRDFVINFFASPEVEFSQEIATKIRGKNRDYLIVAQKYNHNEAAFLVGLDITDRRQAEAKYRSIFENAIEGIFQRTPNWHYLSANPAMARILGYTSSQELIEHLTAIGDHFYVEPQKSQQLIQLLEVNDSVIGFEASVYRKDGTITWISQNLHAVRDQQRNLLYYEGTIEDISERKKAQESLKKINEELERRVEKRTTELRESNQKLENEVKQRQIIEAALRTSEAELMALFAAMTDVITVFDHQGRYVKIITTNSEILYSPPSDRIGKTVTEVLPNEQAQLFINNIQQVLATGKTINVEYSLPIDGQDIWFAASVSPLPNNSVIWVARNITERKRMMDALQEAEEKYRSIFENIAEGIFQSTPEGKLLNINPALVKMYGYKSANEMMNLVNLNQNLYVDLSRRQELINLLENQDSVSHFEARIYRKDRSIIWTSENVRAVKDSRGNLLYYEGTVDDITQRKQAEISLRLEQEKSERLLLNILPKTIAERLKLEQQSIADRFEQVTVLFADLVDFTGISARISPTELVDLLNQIFSSFDQLAEQHELEKIKTIGDAYMVVGGLPMPKSNHAEAIAKMALAMQQEITHFKRDDGTPFGLRIGIHTGPVVAGVIGIKKFSYDLWGDVVNVASRMESQGDPGGIQVTQEIYDLLKNQFRFQKRGQIFVKGKGEMTTYWLLDFNN
jgi:PAS domain S-box-containing protein